MQLSAEGAVQVLNPHSRDGKPIFAVVGKLQFDVMQYRLKDEYGVETTLTPLPYQCSAWVRGDLATFSLPTQAVLMQDKHGNPIALFTSPWEKQYCIKQNPNHELVDVHV
jgi:peptide chain release factor 3